MYGCMCSVYFTILQITDTNTNLTKQAAINYCY